MSARPRYLCSRRLSLRPGYIPLAGAVLASAWSSAVLALCLGLVILFASPSSAFAHTELTGSEPADGQVLEQGVQVVRIVFNEPIEPDLFALDVYNSNRVRVDRRDARVPANNIAALETSLNDLAPGAYTVVWRVLSIDGHVVRGTYAFGVGAGASATSASGVDLEADVPVALSATIRWWTFMAVLVILGGFAFPYLVLRPAVRAAEIAGDAALLATRRFVWVAWGAVVLLLGLGLVGLLVQAAEVTGVPLGEVLNGSAVSRLLVGTKFGTLWMWRMALTGALLGVVAWATLRSRPTAGVWGFGAEIAGAILLTLSYGGHASAVANAQQVAVGMDWLHMLAAAIWTGGLLQLFLVVPAALGHTDTRVFLAALVKRFSLVAILSVTILVGTGVYSSLVHVPSWQALQDTAYGAALTGKLLFVLPLLILGSLNLLAVHPRIRRAALARGRRGHDEAGPHILRRLVIGEVVLIVAVLAVTGLLTGLPPATSVPTEAQPFRSTQAVGTSSVTLDVNPNQAGENNVAITLRDAQGAPIPVSGPVSLAMSHQDMDMAPREVAAEPIGDGQYRLRGGHLSMTGRWRVAVQARSADGVEIATTFAPTVGPAPGTNRPAISPARILLLAVADPSRERGSSVNLRVVAALVVASVGAWVILRALRGDRLRRGAPLAGGAAIVVGLMLFGTSVADAYWRSLPNPVAATAASIERGQQTYQASCAGCHGITGRGDGPDGRFLQPRPADLRVHMAAGHTDQELFDWLSNGVAGTAMPPFSGSLTEEERWHTVNYIRTFGRASSQASDPSELVVRPSQSATVDDGGVDAQTVQVRPGTRSAAPVSSSKAQTSLSDNSTAAPELLAEMIGSTPDGPWREVARWRNLSMTTTDEFTVSGRWRLRWRLETDDEPFVVMVGERQKVPLLLKGQVGVTEGAFYMSPAGTFALMIHTQTPWEVVVDELDSEERAIP